MLRLILIRHGETQSNCDGQYCGWKDVTLTEKGIKQGKRVREKLKEESIDLIISSDLNRTMETAAIINENYGIPMTTMRNLREMNFGNWEGKTYEEIEMEDPENLKKWEEEWIEYAVPQGESVRQMYDRVQRAIDGIVDQYKNKNILIVSHGGCIRVILAHLIGKGLEDYWRYKIDNCGITRIEIMEKFPIITGLNQ